MKYLKKLFGKYGTVIPATGEMIYDVGCTMYDFGIPKFEQLSRVRSTWKSYLENTVQLYLQLVR